MSIICNSIEFEIEIKTEIDFEIEIENEIEFENQNEIEMNYFERTGNYSSNELLDEIGIEAALEEIQDNEIETDAEKQWRKVKEYEH